MSDKAPRPWPALYTWVWPMLVAEARRHGYALGLHGSMARDLDVIAVPCTEEAGPERALVDGLCMATGAELRDGASFVDGSWIRRPGTDPSEKPHGRRAWTLHLDGGGYIDLSIMPRDTPREP